MNSFWRRPLGEYVALTLLWVATRILPLIWFTDGRHCIWEVLQVEKLLQYGFWARKGALLASMMYFGILPNPADYNYVNHPYPIFWFYAIIDWLTGPVVLLVVMALIGLASYLLTYRFLKKLFAAGPAWFSTALLILAHGNIEFDIDINTVAEGALLWPVAALVLLALQDPGHPLYRWAPALLGVLVFLAGQASWFALTLIPALMLLCLPENVRWHEATLRPWSIRALPAIVIGGTLSLLVFIGQIFAYSPSLHGNAQYLQLQMGAGNIVGARLAQLPVLGLRMLLSGPAVWLGALGGIIFYPKANTAQKRLLRAMLLYLLVFIMVILLIPRLVFLNQHAFRYTLFPCAVLTAFGLTWFNRASVKALLGVVAVIGLLFCYAKLHDYQSSMASLTLGRWLASETKPQEVIISNIKYLTPPIKSWDGEFANNVREMSDRLYFQEVDDSGSFSSAAVPFANHLQNCWFLQEASQPMDSALVEQLKKHASSVKSATLTVPEQQLPLYKKARAAVWALLKGHAPQYAPETISQAVETNQFVLTLYQLPPAGVHEIEKSRR